MENLKKAIVFDMEETLERGSHDGPNKESIMTLRPNLDKFMEKLKEVKTQGVDVILCTTAKQSWVDKFLALKPEFKTVFDKIFNRDNEEEWQQINKETHPIEYIAKEEDHSIEYGKPVTTFGYDFVLFIDDNGLEGERLKRLFDLTEGKLEKDVTYFSGYGYWPPNISEIFYYKEAAKNNDEIADMFAEYIDTLRNENGCLMMCSAIDDFMQKEYEPGLTLVDDKYQSQYQEYKKKKDELSEEIEEKVWNLEDELNVSFDEVSTESKKEYELFFQSDKHYPYEGIELPGRENTDRKQLADLVQEATEVQAKVSAAEQLLGEYRNQEQKEENTQEIQ